MKTETRIKLLNVYDGYDPKPEGNPLKELFPKAEVETATLEGLCMLNDTFDIVYCAYALTRIEAKDVPGMMKDMAGLLKNRGELWVAAPALEWAAEQIVSETPSPAVHLAIYGDKDHPARCGFTLAWLRQLVEGANLIPRRAYHSYFQVAVKDQTVQIPLAVCVGWKVE